MPATVLAAYTPYYVKGNLTWVFTPTVASVTAVTRAEINAGTNISKQVTAWSGWSVSSQFKPIPNVNDRFTPKIPGSIESEDSSLTCYLAAAGVDVRQLLPQDTTGFILRFHATDLVGRKMDCFPVTVGSASMPFEDDDAVKVILSFAITALPGTNVTIPA
jgi:hypothetical protein